LKISAVGGLWGCSIIDGKTRQKLLPAQEKLYSLKKINANLFGKAKMVLANLFARPAFVFSAA